MSTYRDDDETSFQQEMLGYLMNRSKYKMSLSMSRPLFVRH